MQGNLNGWGNLSKVATRTSVLYLYNCYFHSCHLSWHSKQTEPTRGVHDSVYLKRILLQNELCLFCHLLDRNRQLCTCFHPKTSKQLRMFPRKFGCWHALTSQGVCWDWESTWKDGKDVAYINYTAGNWHQRDASWPCYRGNANSLKSYLYISFAYANTNINTNRITQLNNIGIIKTLTVTELW